MNEEITAQDETGLLTISDSEKVPTERVKDVNAAQAIYRNLWEADLSAANERTYVDELINGARPFDQEELENEGLGNLSNINWGEAKATIEQTILGYHDLIASPSTLVRPEFPDYVNPATSANWSAIVGLLFTKLFRQKWSLSEIETKCLLREYVTHGLAFALNHKCNDFRFNTAGLKSIRIPRNTVPHEDCLNFFTVEEDLACVDLYSYVKDLDEDDKRWNKKEVINTITNRPKNSRIEGDSEQLESDLKQHALFYGAGFDDKVTVVHLYVKEFSEKVSHYIFAKPAIPNADTNEEEEKLSGYIFRHVEEFDCMADIITVFPFGVGDGTLHSIRGQGYDIFPFASESNILRNEVLTASKDSMKLLTEVQGTLTDQTKLAVQTIGNMVVLPPNLKFVQRTLPNVSQQVQPVIQDLSNLMKTNTSQYTGRAPSQPGSRKSKDQWLGEQMDANALSTSAFNGFYTCWERLIRKVFMLCIRKDVDPCDPDYDLVLWFQKAVAKAGVDINAVHDIKDVEVVRATGYGSPAVRKATFQEGLTFLPYLDEEGKYRMVQDALVDLFGPAKATEYLPVMGTQRTPVDFTLAQLENGHMEAGKVIEPRSDDQHVIHAQVHLAKINEIIAATEDPANVEMAVRLLAIFIPHTKFHVDQVAQRDPLGASLREVLQQVVAQTIRIRNEYEGMIKNAQKQQEAQAQAEQEQLQTYIADLEKRAAQAPEAAEQRKLMMEQARYEVKLQAIKEELRMKLHAEAEKGRMLLQNKQAEMLLQQIQQIPNE